jgi:hypothetical protein
MAYTKTMSHKIPKRNTQVRKAKKQSSSSTSSQEDEVPCQLAIEIDSLVKSRIGQVLNDRGFQRWIKENDIKPSPLIKSIISAPPAGKKTAAAASKVPLKVLNEVLSPKFDDCWVEKGCIVSHTHRPPAGKLPYTLCGASCGRDLVCESCSKKAAGKTLKESTGRTGFNIEKHRANNIDRAKKWATNKKKQLDKEDRGKILVEKSGSSSSSQETTESKSDSSSSDEDEAPKWTPYEHNEKGGEKYSYLEEEGLVAKMKQGDYIVIGIDKDNSGTIDKLSKSEALKYEKQRFVIDQSAVEGKSEEKTEGKTEEKTDNKNDADANGDKPKQPDNKTRNKPIAGGVRRPAQVRNSRQGS